MDKETLYALLGLGIGGLGGYFGQRSLDKRRAGDQLSLEDQERLAKISAGIDPDTNLPYGYQEPEEEGPGFVDSTKELVNKAIEAYNESDFNKDFVQQQSNDPRFEAPTPDRNLVQALIEEGEDLLFGNVDYEDLGKVVPVGNVDEDFYMPAEANRVLTTAGDIIPRSTATEEMAGLSQTPQDDFYIPRGGDGDIYLEGPTLESDLMLLGPTVDQRGTELVDNPRIPNFIEYLGGDEALTPKGEQFYEDYISDPIDAVKDFFTTGGFFNMDYSGGPESIPIYGGPVMFNQGGRVGLEPGGSLSDDITDLMSSLSMYKGPDSMMAQLSDAEDFLRAEILEADAITGPKYNYTLGMGLDDLMPGLSFEAGVMDDAVFGPGMTSPDDYKFLKFKKTF